MTPGDYGRCTYCHRPFDNPSQYRRTSHGVNRYTPTSVSGPAGVRACRNTAACRERCTGDASARERWNRYHSARQRIQTEVG